MHDYWRLSIHDGLEYENVQIWDAKTHSKLIGFIKWILFKILLQFLSLGTKTLPPWGDMEQKIWKDIGHVTVLQICLHCKM